MKKIIAIIAIALAAGAASADLLGQMGGSDYINGGGVAISTNLGNGAVGWHAVGENATYTNLAGGGRFTGAGTGAQNFQVRDSNNSLSDTLGFLTGVGTSAIGDQAAIVGMVAFGSSSLTNLFLDYASSGTAGSFDTTARVVIVVGGVFKISDATMLPINNFDVGSRTLTGAQLAAMNWVTWNPIGTIAEWVTVDTSGGSTMSLDANNGIADVTGAGVWYGRTQTAAGAFGFGTINGIIATGVVPEPATALLFGVGGFGAWMLRRNNRKAKEEQEG